MYYSNATNFVTAYSKPTENPYSMGPPPPPPLGPGALSVIRDLLMLHRQVKDILHCYTQ